MESEMQECLRRRNELANLLPNCSAIILSSAKQHKRSGDQTYDFRQNACFAYFTGFIEDQAVAIITKDSEAKINYILFCSDKDPAIEVWNGEIIGQEAAKSEYLANEAYSIKNFAKDLIKLLNGFPKIYYIDDVTSHKVYKDGLELLKAQQEVRLINYTDKVKALRIIKSPYEIELLKIASNASAMAHRRLMLECRAGLREDYLAAIFYADLIKFGGDGLSYPTIVGSGENATILHHSATDRFTRDGELLLVDAGGEVDYYASDITRTYPVNGRFTESQKAIYNIVLNVQKKAIDLVKPGVSMQAIEKFVIKEIVLGLMDLDILTGALEENLRNQCYKKYYMHGFGHTVGLDVHDVHTDVLRANMVLTIEPGIYIKSDDVLVNPKWRGVGVRIEDCVLVTPTGSEVLTKSVPKEVDQIERLMTAGRQRRLLDEKHIVQEVETIEFIARPRLRR